MRCIFNCRPFLALAVMLGLTFVLPAHAQNLIRNGSFEVAPFANGWTVDPGSSTLGKAFRSTSSVRTGNFSLEITPYANNTSLNPFQRFTAIQLIPIEKLRGKTIYFSGWLGARDGATAVLRMFTVGTPVVEHRTVRLETSNSRPVYFKDAFDVPDDPSLFALAIGCTAEGTSGAAYFDDVLVTTEAPPEFAALSMYNPGPPLNATIEIAPNQVYRTIPPAIFGMNLEWALNGQGVWNEEYDRLQPEIIQLARDMGIKQWRFPGGIFSDLYHWRDGIGPRNLRPPSVFGPAVFSNGFGTDEAFEFAEATDANLMITVNVLSGTPEEAADWVRYVNKDGRRVTEWEIGNELYLDFTQFDPPRENWTAERYARAYMEFAKAIRAVDPSLRLGAHVEYNYSPSSFRVHPGWEDTVLQIAGSEIDFIAVHNAFAPVLPIADAGWDVRTVYSSFLAAPVLIKKSLRKLVETIKTQAPLNADRIQIGITEWGPGFHIEPGSRWSDHLKTLGSALYAAGVLKVLIEEPKVESAHAFKLSDGGTIGWIGLRRQTYVAKPVAYALEMFTKHFGRNAVVTKTSSPTYDSRSMGLIDAVEDVPYLDVVSSISDDRRTLYVMGINKHFDRPIRGFINLDGYVAGGMATAWTLSGTALDANTGTELPAYTGVTLGQQATIEPNGRFDFGGPDEVGIKSEALNLTGNAFEYDFPPHSVTALVIDLTPYENPVPYEGPDTTTRPVIQ